MIYILAVLKKPYTWLKILQLLGGIVCFGLYCHKDSCSIAYIFKNWHKDNHVNNLLNAFTTATIAGYPVIIVLPTLIALGLSESRHKTTILCLLQSFVGCGMYLSISTITARYASMSVSKPAAAFAAFCVITSFLFLIEVVDAIMQLCWSCSEAEVQTTGPETRPRPSKSETSAMNTPSGLTV